jgi:hypothetical protein
MMQRLAPRSIRPRRIPTIVTDHPLRAVVAGCHQGRPLESLIRVSVSKRECHRAPNWVQSKFDLTRISHRRAPYRTIHLKMAATRRCQNISDAVCRATRARRFRRPGRPDRCSAAMSSRGRSPADPGWPLSSTSKARGALSISELPHAGAMLSRRTALRQERSRSGSAARRSRGRRRLSRSEERERRFRRASRAYRPSSRSPALAVSWSPPTASGDRSPVQTAALSRWRLSTIRPSMVLFHRLSRPPGSGLRDA